MVLKSHVMKFGALLALAVPVLFFTVPSASAEGACENAWFARNLIAHRGGHCFSSALGKAVFGNQGCLSSGARLTPENETNMAQIKSMEKAWGCRINTSRTTIDVPERHLLVELELMPVRDDTESSCIGYLGAVVPLYSAPRQGAQVVGTITKGVNVNNSHLPKNGWDFHEIMIDSRVLTMGWTNVDIWDQGCENYAG